MKRFIAILTAATLFALGLTGAISGWRQQEYTVLAVTSESWGGYFGYDVVNQMNELPKRSPVIKDYSQPEKTLELSFNGKRYTATYEDPGYPETVVSYWAPADPQSGIPEVRFFVNRYTGFISRAAYWNYDDIMKDTDRPVLDQAACEQIAKDFFEDLVDDPQAYQISCSDRGESEIDRYYFVFMRYINGIETTDDAYIYVSVYGDVTEYSCSGLGSMKGVTLPRLDSDSLHRALQKKLAYLFAPTPSQYTLEHNLISTRLIKLNDGTLALECYYHTTLDSSLTRSDYLYVVME